MDTPVLSGAEPSIPPPPQFEKRWGTTRPDPDEGALSRGLRWSFFVHGAIVVAVLIKSLVFPGEPIPYIPTLRVDVVGLPDLLKKDMANLNNAPPPSGGAAKKEQEATETPKAKGKSEEVADPSEMVLKGKKDTKKDAAKENPKDRQKKLKNALARIKALDKIMADSGVVKDAPKAGAGPIIKGNAVSHGTSLSGDARESAVASYYDTMRDRLQENWTLPVWIARQNLSARVQVFIDARGAVKGFRFVKPSGNAQFDEAVKRALTASQPFPTPPENIAGTLLVDGVLVGFPL